MKANRYHRIKHLLDRRQVDFTVLMEQVHKPHNLAAVVRTADAVGIGEVHAVRPEGEIHQCGGTAMGSQRWVETHRHNNLSQALSAIRKKNMQVLAAHLSDKAVDFRSIDYTKPTCILLGAEKEGVSETAAQAADQHIIIPMLGMVQSLNVSVANAIILYEAQRQREQAGLYKERKLDPLVAERLTFEWLHPQITAFCKQHSIRYPDINDEGDIDDRDWQALRHSVSSAHR